MARMSAGIYHLEKETGTWEQIVRRNSGCDNFSGLLIDDAFYVGTEHRGVLRL